MHRKIVVATLIITLIVIAGIGLNTNLFDQVDNDLNSEKNIALNEEVNKDETLNQNPTEEDSAKSDVNKEVVQELNEEAVRDLKQATIQEANRGQAKTPTTKLDQSKVPTSTNDGTTQSRNQLEAELINLINKERKAKGFKPLVIDNQVTTLARKKSEDMRDNNYFATNSPTYGVFTEMLKASSINYRTATEKIAGGYQSAQEVFNNWQKDASFIKSILDPSFNHIGVGYASGGGEYRYYWTLWLLEKPTVISENTQSNFEQEVLRLVNIERSNRGLKPLTWDSQLAKVARAKSEDMRDKNYFAHQSPTYGSLGEMLKFFNISYSSAAENIAAGQKTPPDVVKGWMNSEGHRKNILDPKLTHLGVGYADGSGNYFVYWTQIFTAKP